MPLLGGEEDIDDLLINDLFSSGVAPAITPPLFFVWAWCLSTDGLWKIHGMVGRRHAGGGLGGAALI